MFCYIIGFASLVGKTHDTAGALGDDGAEGNERPDATREQSIDTRIVQRGKPGD